MADSTETDQIDHRQVNGNSHKNASADGSPESELSEPDSNVHSPPGVEFDEIIVRSRANGTKKSTPPRALSDKEDQTMVDINDEPVVSHYPKRKRTSLYHDLSESKIDSTNAVEDKSSTPSAPAFKPKPPRQSLSSVKGVVVGWWRDSPAPDLKIKHAVIGFIDVRDRLRTRIQPMTVSGDPVPTEYPLPPGPGGSWVTFERIVFSDHLVGLDHLQVKEYVRVRADAFEDNDAARKAAEKEAVKEAIRRAKENALLDPNPNVNLTPSVAYGLEIPEGANISNRPEVKRRRISGGFSAINPAQSNGVSHDQTSSQYQTPTQNMRSSLDPLAGTRPTRILLGYWKLSSEPQAKDRHAVYGILGQNDMFRVKLVRETRDGRFVDGNFPVGAGALWIPYEEVEFENHLRALTRTEIKEYCRVRQWQIDHGETSDERITNETKAVYEAQARVGNGGFKVVSPSLANFSTAPSDDTEVADAQPVRNGMERHELRQSRRGEPRAERLIRQAPPSEPETRTTTLATRLQTADAMERTNSLARRELTRFENTQGRAVRHAENRERAAAAAADAAAAAAAAIPGVANGSRSQFHDREEMQRLNKAWAKQEHLRLKNGPEDAKIYGGIKYERRTNGPFIGKLTSAAALISIDGEDYVEYRVLTKPGFF